MNYNLISDIELLCLIKEDDDVKAFEEVYKRYWAIMYQCAWKRLSDQEICKDVVQDIFVYFWKRHSMLTIDNIEAWLKTAVKYQIYKRIAQNKAGDAIYASTELQERSDQKADDLVRTKELSYALQLFIAQLPTKRREIFCLRYQENLSTADIAEKLEISRKTVQNQLAKAVDNIQSSLSHLVILLFLLWRK